MALTDSSPEQSLVVQESASWDEASLRSRICDGPFLANHGNRDIIDFLRARSRPNLGRNDPQTECIRIARHERHFVLRPDPP